MSYNTFSFLAVEQWRLAETYGDEYDSERCMHLFISVLVVYCIDINM